MEKEIVKKFRQWMYETGHTLLERGIFRMWVAGFRSGECSEREECLAICEKIMQFGTGLHEPVGAQRGTIGVYKDGELHHGELDIKNFSVVSAMIAASIRARGAIKNADYA